MTQPTTRQAKVKVKAKASNLKKSRGKNSGDAKCSIHPVYAVLKKAKQLSKSEIQQRLESSELEKEKKSQSLREKQAKRRNKKTLNRSRLKHSTIHEH